MITPSTYFKDQQSYSILWDCIRQGQVQTFIHQINKTKTPHFLQFLIPMKQMIAIPLLAIFEVDKWLEFYEAIANFSTSQSLSESLEKLNDTKNSRMILNSLFWNMNLQLMNKIQANPNSELIQRIIAIFIPSKSMFHILFKMLFQPNRLYHLVDSPDHINHFYVPLANKINILPLSNQLRQYSKTLSQKYLRQKIWDQSNFIPYLKYPHLLTLEVLQQNWFHELARQEKIEEMLASIESLLEVEKQHGVQLVQRYFHQFNTSKQTPTDIIMRTWGHQGIIKFCKQVQSIDSLNLSRNCINCLLMNQKLSQNEIQGLVTDILDGKISNGQFCEQPISYKKIKVGDQEKEISWAIEDSLITTDYYRVIKAKSKFNEYPLLTYLIRFNKSLSLHIIQKLFFKTLKKKHIKKLYHSTLQCLNNKKVIDDTSVWNKFHNDILYYYEPLLRQICSIENQQILQFFIDQLFLNYNFTSAFSRAKITPANHFIGIYISKQPDLSENSVNRTIFERITDAKQQKYSQIESDQYIDCLFWTMAKFQKFRDSQEWLPMQVKTFVKQQIFQKKKVRFTWKQKNDFSWGYNSNGKSQKIYWRNEEIAPSFLFNPQELNILFISQQRYTTSDLFDQSSIKKPAYLSRNIKMPVEELEEFILLLDSNDRQKSSYQVECRTLDEPDLMDKIKLLHQYAYNFYFRFVVPNTSNAKKIDKMFAKLIEVNGEDFWTNAIKTMIYKRIKYHQTLKFHEALLCCEDKDTDEIFNFIKNNQNLSEKFRKSISSTLDQFSNQLAYPCNLRLVQKLREIEQLSNAKQTIISRISNKINEIKFGKKQIKDEAFQFLMTLDTPQYDPHINIPQFLPYLTEKQRKTVFDKIGNLALLHRYPQNHYILLYSFIYSENILEHCEKIIKLLQNKQILSDENYSYWSQQQQEQDGEEIEDDDRSKLCLDLFNSARKYEAKRFYERLQELPYPESSIAFQKLKKYQQSFIFTNFISAINSDPKRVEFLKIVNEQLSKKDPNRKYNVQTIATNNAFPLYTAALFAYQPGQIHWKQTSEQIRKQFILYDQRVRQSAVMNNYKAGSDRWRMVYGKFSNQVEFINPKDYLIKCSEIQYQTFLLSLQKNVEAAPQNTATKMFLDCLFRNKQWEKIQMMIQIKNMAKIVSLFTYVFRWLRSELISRAIPNRQGFDELIQQCWEILSNNPSIQQESNQIFWDAFMINPQKCLAIFQDKSNGKQFCIWRKYLDHYPQMYQQVLKQPPQMSDSFWVYNYIGKQMQISNYIEHNQHETKELYRNHQKQAQKYQIHRKLMQIIEIQKIIQKIHLNLDKYQKGSWFYESQKEQLNIANNMLIKQLKDIFMHPLVIQSHYTMFKQENLKQISHLIFHIPALSSLSQIPSHYLHVYLSNNHNVVNHTWFLKSELIKQIIDRGFVKGQQQLWDIVKSNRMDVIDYYLNSMEISLCQELMWRSLYRSTFIDDLLMLANQKFIIDFIKKYKIIELSSGLYSLHNWLLIALSTKKQKLFRMLLRQVPSDDSQINSQGYLLTDNKEAALFYNYIGESVNFMEIMDALVSSVAYFEAQQNFSLAQILIDQEFFSPDPDNQQQQNILMPNQQGYGEGRFRYLLLICLRSYFEYNEKIIEYVAQKMALESSNEVLNSLVQTLIKSNQRSTLCLFWNSIEEHLKMFYQQKDKPMKGYQFMWGEPKFKNSIDILQDIIEQDGDIDKFISFNRNLTYLESQAFSLFQSIPIIASNELEHELMLGETFSIQKSDQNTIRIQIPYQIIKDESKKMVFLDTDQTLHEIRNFYVIEYLKANSTGNLQQSQLLGPISYAYQVSSFQNIQNPQFMANMEYEILRPNQVLDKPIQKCISKIADKWTELTTTMEDELCICNEGQDSIMRRICQSVYNKITIKHIPSLQEAKHSSSMVSDMKQYLTFMKNGKQNQHQYNFSAQVMMVQKYDYCFDRYWASNVVEFLHKLHETNSFQFSYLRSITPLNQHISKFNYCIESIVSVIESIVGKSISSKDVIDCLTYLINSKNSIDVLQRVVSQIEAKKIQSEMEFSKIMIKYVNEPNIGQSCSVLRILSKLFLHTIQCSLQNEMVIVKLLYTTECQPNIVSRIQQCNIQSHFSSDFDKPIKENLDIDIKFNSLQEIINSHLSQMYKPYKDCKICKNPESCEICQTSPIQCQIDYSSYSTYIQNKLNENGFKEVSKQVQQHQRCLLEQLKYFIKRQLNPSTQEHYNSIRFQQQIQKLLNDNNQEMPNICYPLKSLIFDHPLLYETRVVKAQTRKIEKKDFYGISQSKEIEVLCETESRPTIRNKFMVGLTLRNKQLIEFAKSQKLIKMSLPNSKSQYFQICQEYPTDFPHVIDNLYLVDAQNRFLRVKQRYLEDVLRIWSEQTGAKLFSQLKLPNKLKISIEIDQQQAQQEVHVRTRLNSFSNNFSVSLHNNLIIPEKLHHKYNSKLREAIDTFKRQIKDYYNISIELSLSCELQPSINKLDNTLKRLASAFNTISSPYQHGLQLQTYLNIEKHEVLVIDYIKSRKEKLINLKKLIIDVSEDGRSAIELDEQCIKLHININQGQLEDIEEVPTKMQKRMVEKIRKQIDESRYKIWLHQIAENSRQNNALVNCLNHILFAKQQMEVIEKAIAIANTIKPRYKTSYQIHLKNTSKSTITYSEDGLQFVISCSRNSHTFFSQCDTLYFLLNQSQLKTRSFSAQYVRSRNAIELKGYYMQEPTYIILIKGDQTICQQIFFYQNSKQIGYPFSDGDKFEKFYVLLETEKSMQMVYNYFYQDQNIKEIRKNKYYKQVGIHQFRLSFKGENQTQLLYFYGKDPLNSINSLSLKYTLNNFKKSSNQGRYYSLLQLHPNVSYEIKRLSLNLWIILFKVKPRGQLLIFSSDYNFHHKRGVNSLYSTMIKS